MSQEVSERGSGHWWAQRLTAVALFFLGLWFLISILVLDNLRFDAVSTWLGNPLNLLLMLVTFETTVYHSKLGVQVVIEDYVHGPAIKVLSIRMNMLAHIFFAIAGLYAFLRIGFSV